MARFYFHVRDGGDISRDCEGQELSGVEAARREAISANREMLSEWLLHGGSLNYRQIEIADETGHIVDVILAADVLLKNGQPRRYDDDVTQSAPVNAPLR